MADNSSVDGSEGRGAFFQFDISQDAAFSANFGRGMDVVALSASTPVKQVRLTFTSSEVGNNNAVDSATSANQDGGLAVRLQTEDDDGNLSGQISRTDDEGINFISDGTFTFDVRDLVSGIARGDQFSVVRLGTNAADFYDEGASTRNTYINAGMGNDDVTGGSGDDFLVGGAGDDRLFGGQGNDSFIGGGGNDVIAGGAGDDTAIFNVSTDGADIVNLGGGLNDRVLVSAATGTTQVRLTFTSAEVGNGAAVDGGTLANQDGRFAVRLQAEDASGMLTGAVSRLDDEGTSFVSSTPGLTFDVRDLVSGVARGDQFEIARLGTSRADVFDDSASTRAIYTNAGMGDDTVTGGGANDFLVGGAGNDTLSGGDGNDSFIGGGGNDTIFGGTGDDTAIFNISTDGTDRVNLGTGLDRANVAAAVGASQIRLSFTSAEVGNDNANDGGTLTNQDGALAVRMQLEDGNDGLIGGVSRFDDEGTVFTSTTAGVTFDVRDLVSGAQRGNQFSTVVLGTAAADVFDYTAATTSIYVNAGMGDDIVRAGSVGSFLVGGGGLDRLFGGDGNDSFIGGGGDDVIFGGRGNDTVIHDVATAGADRVNLGIGDDIVNVSSSTGGNRVRLTFTSAEVGNGNAVDSGTLANQDGGFAVRVQAQDALGELTGAVSRFDDEGTTFVSTTPGLTFDVRDLVSGVSRGGAFEVAQLGTGAADTIDHSADDEAYYVNAGGGNDIVTGGTGEDFLVGGAGNDTLNGSEGMDMLLGGAGADIFAFSGNPDFDTILDFVSGTDKIDLSAFGITADNVFTLSTDTETVVFVDQDADGFADFGITLAGVAVEPAPGDYIF